MPCDVYDSISRPNLPVPRNLAEDIPHRDVDPVRKLTQHRTLRALAAARHSEQDDRTIAMSFFHDSDPPPKVISSLMCRRFGQDGKQLRPKPAARRPRCQSVAFGTSLPVNGSGRPGRRYATPPSSIVEGKEQTVAAHAHIAGEARRDLGPRPLPRGRV